MVRELALRAKKASRQLSVARSPQKDQALLRLADLLTSDQNEVLMANQQDLEDAHRTGLQTAMLERLTLTPSRLEDMSSDLGDVSALPDPIGEQFDHTVRPNGLHVHKQRVPLGVVGVIYESRPNVTIDVTGLTLKTGNAAILRGGSESIHTNRALVKLVHRALSWADLPQDSIQFIDDVDRARVTELLQQHDLIDMLIPRGGQALHAYCRENSRIPVITGGIGICHLFVDESADLEASLPLIRNAKIQRPTVCNALDTLLVHERAAQNILPKVIQLLSADGVRFKADPSTLPILENQGLSNYVEIAGENDFDTEWLSLVLGLKLVSSLDEAIDHIETHSTFHSDGILTESEENARRFIAEVDSSAVYVNASTRFTDGGQLGLGAEIAVSTQRLHARGPMGLRELTTYKWVIQGNYLFRQ